ncbi:mycothiol synthase [Jatrophihabitans endophyticus]|uniref:Mycothiol acetyltransferase n=1 Tax=Jatrophihabitans endophyticus TaxID=1206085 RepID=A0A1M5IAU4_9ACTN|nr:mycothiol synthase [Jatrophihabitans endophyticus]SHG25484.1 mycothiol synthase [Jatrophihabitans endophyticus]
MPIDTTVPDPETGQAVLALADSVEQKDGAPPLSDRARTHLRSAGVEHLVVRAGDEVRAYGQLDGDELELVAADGAAADAVLDAVDRPVAVWSHGTHSRLIDVFAARGYERRRELFQLRRPGEIPLPADPPLADGITVRCFDAGRDEDAWLALNAAAFANHPEQGRLTLEDLRAREAEPWFDPAGFLLAERDGELLGFHWTKIHPDGAGEVYVLGIAPGGQRLGLGRGLLVRGLRHLAGRGCPYVLLYVDGDNPSAVRLYEREAFARHDVDVQWRTG